LLMMVLGVSLAWLTGDPRLLLAKSALLTARAGLYCVVICLGRPLCYETAKPFATGGDPDRLADWEFAWQHSAALRRSLRVLTMVWGVDFLAESVARVVIVYSLPMNQAVLAAQIPGVVAIVVLVVTTRLLVPWTRAAAEASRPSDRVSPAA
jgi:hypothetical protein